MHDYDIKETKAWLNRAIPSLDGGATDFHARVAYMLARSHGCGYYDVPQLKDGKGEWKHDLVSVLTDTSRLSTHDYGGLTRLVVLAHRFGIRVSVHPCAPRFMRLRFHERQHPDLTDVVKAVI